MSINYREHLTNEKRVSGIPIFLLGCAIIFILAYGHFFPGPQLYLGFIRQEPESARSKSYISFHLIQENSQHSFMVLLKDPAFHAKVEAMLDKQVQVKALLFYNEPDDFDKIEIFEIKKM